ncbi:Uu.00g063820.m01.CDS01 [Anthostomella pinea]|uniref:Uu.00g063820.m01.CDS01 n=1 Tax=Anthostomella pinea TaxID=933095 RepID=A0AAI8YKM0_9PEZI|nr:Uu.00g063820.m01.CDS01 [Anthostomella pinea]
MKSFIAALALVAPAYAGLRFACSQLTIQRLDPIVNPGQNPSRHVHQIVGGNAFNVTMTGDIGAEATCTTCEMSEDLSNYWTPVLYFKHPTNGSYHRVPIIKNTSLANGTKGGMTIYYTPHDLCRDGLEQQPITAFPKGFRMTVGSPTTSTEEQAKAHAGLRFQCLVNTLNRGPETADFPTEPCPGGIFASHHFPACWDGKNVDSPDHQSHMYNTIEEDGFENAPPCPASHPVRVPQLTLETVWDTTKFNDMWPKGAPNPFMWSFNGTKGYGTHADYLFGWKDDSLQRAMNQSECFYDGCGILEKQTMDVANQCTVPEMVGEETDGWLTELPGQGADMPMK